MIKTSGNQNSKTSRVSSQDDHIIFDKVGVYVFSYFSVGNLKLNKKFSMSYCTTSTVYKVYNIKTALFWSIKVCFSLKHSKSSISGNMVEEVIWEKPPSKHNLKRLGVFYFFLNILKTLKIWQYHRELSGQKHTQKNREVSWKPNLPWRHFCTESKTDVRFWIPHGASEK